MGFQQGNQAASGRLPTGRRAVDRAIVESFLELDDDGEAAGIAALRKLRDEDPEAYLALCAKYAAQQNVPIPRGPAMPELFA